MVHKGFSYEFSPREAAYLLFGKKIFCLGRKSALSAAAVWRNGKILKCDRAQN